MHSATIFLLRVSNALTWTVTWSPSSIDGNDFYLQVNIPLFSSFWKKENISEKKIFAYVTIPLTHLSRNMSPYFMKNLKNKVYKASHKNFYFRFFHQSTFFHWPKNINFLVDSALLPFCTDSWFFVPHTLRIHWKFPILRHRVSLTALVNLRYSQSWSIPTDGHNQCWSIPTDGHNQRWSIPKDGSQPMLINTWGRVTTKETAKVVLQIFWQ